MRRRIAKAARHAVPWTCIAGAFVVWIAAVGVMAAMPSGRAASSRVGEPTGLLVLHQDPRTLQSVAVREVRPL
ncbi:MAG: hypothetical protein IT562_19335 [Alphaproteobacteria bacterium]|nr:hypothetical protein [Alphaproteobacteria bacterium]